MTKEQKISKLEAKVSDLKIKYDEAKAVYESAKLEYEKAAFELEGFKGGGPLTDAILDAFHKSGKSAEEVIAFINQQPTNRRTVEER